MAKKRQHVVYSDGKWSVRRAGAARASRTFATQKEAIENAREKARVLANELDVRLVRVISFSENNSNGRAYYESYGMGSDAVKVSSAPTLPAGENMTTISVTVTYEIR